MDVLYFFAGMACLVIPLTVLAVVGLCVVLSRGEEDAYQ